MLASVRGLGQESGMPAEGVSAPPPFGTGRVPRRVGEGYCRNWYADILRESAP